MPKGVSSTPARTIYHFGCQVGVISRLLPGAGGDVQQTGADSSRDAGCSWQLRGCAGEGSAHAKAQLMVPGFGFKTCARLLMPSPEDCLFSAVTPSVAPRLSAA